jgi:hypothetical protein
MSRLRHPHHPPGRHYGGCCWGRLIPAVICLIVGAHFFPLAHVFDQPQFGWTGTALCLVGAVGLVLVPAVGGEAARAVVGLSAAVTLWVASLYTSSNATPR